MKPHDSPQSLFRSFLPPELIDSGEPVFAEPWQAQAFAMTIALFERGLFNWSEWADTLTEKLGERVSTGDDQGGRLYYEDWLAALETLVSDRTELDASVLGEKKDQWERAYRTTPHGEKVSL